MYIQLVRESFTDKATEGKMFVNGTFECYTLEDMDRGLEDGGTKVYGLTAIPRGKYEIKLTMSPRFGILLPLLLDVPGFSGVRIHKGNTSKNTEGCILVGANNSKDDDDFIGSSKIAFDKLMAQMTEVPDNEPITLEIV